MSALTGKNITATYKDLLHVPNGNAGVDATMRSVFDGEGTSSALQVSTTGVKSGGTLEVATLPTSDPSNAGQLWKSGGFIMEGNTPAALDTLTDVTITTPAPGQFLKWNGSAFANFTPTLQDLSNVASGTPNNLDILRYNASSGEYEPISREVLLNLTDIFNVHAPTPTDGHLLKWVAGNSRWESAANLLSQADDTNFGPTTDLDRLVYDGSEGKWKNMSRYAYDSGWITELATGGSPVTLAANAIGYETLSLDQATYFPFEVVIWGRSSSIPEDVYRIVSAVAQGSVTNTVGADVRYETDTRNLFLFLQDLAVYHEASSGLANSLAWGYIDEIRITIPR